MVVVVVGQPITDPISGPSFDFTFTIGPELDNRDNSQLKTLPLCNALTDGWFIANIDCHLLHLVTTFFTRHISLVSVRDMCHVSTDPVLVTPLYLRLWDKDTWPGWLSTDNWYRPWWLWPGPQLPIGHQPWSSALIGRERGLRYGDTCWEVTRAL